MYRKTISLLLVLLIGGFSIKGLSQDIPKGISYQAVARDAQGKELVNKSISVRFSVLKGSEEGPATYIETQNVSTDQFGLFNLTIGAGTVGPESEVETFDEIDWGAAHYFLKVEVDFGSGFRHVGSMPFLSVPYALYAARAGSSNVAVVDSQDLSLIDNTLTLSNDPTSVNLEKYLDNTDNQNLIWDPVNQHITIQGGNGLVIDLESYKQKLAIEGRNLSISGPGGNSILLPPDADADSTNELQTMSIEGNELKLKTRYGITNSTVNLAPYVQDLSINDNVLKITNNPNAASINLFPYLDNTDNQKLSRILNDSLKIDRGNAIKIDFDPTNEIQDLYFTPANNKLKITNNASATVVDLSKYIDNTDTQKLAYNNGNLSISNGNSVPINPTIGFRATKALPNSVPLLKDTTIVFNSFDYNLGNCYNVLTGVFTATIDGFYSFYLNFVPTGNGQEIKIYKDYAYYETLIDNTSTGAIKTSSFIVKLLAGETIKIVLYTGAGATCGTGSLTGVKIQ